MTYRRFLTTLRRLVKKQGWQAKFYDSFGMLGPRKLIRLESPDCENHCPVTAVCAAVEGITYLLSEADSAGLLLGLEDILVQHVITAADERPWSEFGAINDGKKLKIRSQLLKALGLQEPVV